jgi:hypothetical protein
LNKAVAGKKKSPGFGDIDCTQNFFSDSGQVGCNTGSAASTTPAGIKTGAHVDKVLHIHRIECAQPWFALTADLLSSFAPVRIQGFSSAKKRA